MSIPACHSCSNEQQGLRALVWKVQKKKSEGNKKSSKFDIALLPKLLLWIYSGEETVRKIIKYKYEKKKKALAYI